MAKDGECSYTGSTILDPDIVNQHEPRSPAACCQLSPVANIGIHRDQRTSGRRVLSLLATLDGAWDLGCVSMAEIVLRVRLMSGDQLDVRYEEAAVDEDEVIQRVIETLAEGSGVLRTRHGDRLIVLYGRGVVAIEVAPRGAVL